MNINILMDTEIQKKKKRDEKYSKHTSKASRQPSKGNWFCFLWKRARVTANIFYVFLKTESAIWKKNCSNVDKRHHLLWSIELPLFSLSVSFPLFSIPLALSLSLSSVGSGYIRAAPYIRVWWQTNMPAPYANASHRIRFHIQMCRCTNYPIMLHTVSVRLVG